jgi:hypothetical protein
MGTLTYAAALIAASHCGSPGVKIDPDMLVRQALRESGLRSDAIGERNSNHTRDWGITQINESNFGLLRVDAASLIDPTPIIVGGQEIPRGVCVAFRAQVDLLRIIARYNGSGPAALKYAEGIINGRVTARSRANAPEMLTRGDPALVEQDIEDLPDK